MLLLFISQQEISPIIVFLSGISDPMVYTRSNIKNINPIQPACKKAIYNSLEEAQDMIAHIKETRVVREISAYKCTICGFWHLTSRTKGCITFLLFAYHIFGALPAA